MLSKNCLQLSLIALIILVKLAELKSIIPSYLSPVVRHPTSAATLRQTPEQQNLVLLNMLKLVITSRKQNLNQTRYIRQQQQRRRPERRVRTRDTRVMTSSSSLGSELLSGGDGDEPRQFCGETLYYVVEYYCVYVKGTSVYVPNGDDDDDEEEIDENSFDNKKQSDLKSKRNTIDDNGNFAYFFFIVGSLISSYAAY